MANLRAGVIGLGVMGRNHARILSSLDGVSLVGIVDPLGTEGRHQAELLDSTEALIARGVDYCFVAVPTALHEQVGTILASAGVHALVEKPLAADLASATRLTAAFESAGVIGAVGHIERYNSALEYAKKRIQNGELGDLYQVTTRRQGPFPGRISDVGVVKDLATHDIDLTSWVADRAYVNVAARTALKAGRSYEDLVAVIAELENRIVVNHTVNWLSPLKERQAVLLGERGALVVDTLSSDLTFFANGSIESPWAEVALFRGVTEGDAIRYAIPKPEPLRREHEEFRNAVLGLEANVVTMREGLAVVGVAEAILKSSATGQVVKLETP